MSVQPCGVSGRPLVLPRRGLCQAPCHSTPCALRSFSRCGATSTQHASTSSTRTVELSVTGLRGPECAAKIKQTLEEMPGVTAADADTEGRLVTVTADPDVSLRTMMETVRRLECGYRAVPYRERVWKFRGHDVNYAEAGTGRPIVLVHGFGGNCHHYRKLLADLSTSYRVLAPDLLGFGASAKPADLTYDPHLWQAQVAAFLEEVVREKCVLVGNSIGSQVALYVAANAGHLAEGVCLLGCAGGMNWKGLYQDSALLSAMRPLFSIVEFLLKQRPIARRLFDTFRSRERVEALLRAPSRGLPPPYANPEAVNAELVDILCTPAFETGALDVFVGVFTGDPGPRPEALLERVSCPVLVAWGAADPWTPVDSPVAAHLEQLAQSRPDRVQMVRLPDCGHCPQDDRPELVVAELVPWLDRVLPRAIIA